MDERSDLSSAHPHNLSEINSRRETDEKELIIRTLEKTHYNKTKAALALGISRTMLYQKLKKYKIDL